MSLPPEMQQAVGNFYQAPQAPVQQPRRGGFGGLVDRVRFGGGVFQNFGSNYNPSNPYANIDPYRYAGLDNKENPGDKLLADLIRAQTRDYQTRFAPVENMLASSITRTGTAFLPQELERTRSSITGAAQSVQGTMNRDAQRMGIAPQQMDQNSVTASMVGGLNQTRTRDEDRRLELLTGGLSGITQGARNVGR